MRRITLLPSLLTLANAFCGLLAVSKGIDALAHSQSDPALFYPKLESAALLIFLGMVFDALDGRVARITGGSSEFGAQLDSFSDLLTFGVAPAVLAKVLIEHDGPLSGYTGNPRLHFLGAAFFALMAILRLARFNLETEPDESAHREFRGLPTPAAAGCVASTVLAYLTLSRRELEVADGSPTPVGWLMSSFPEFEIHFPAWFFAGLALWLPTLGVLMVSRVRYAHVASALMRRSQFDGLVKIVAMALVLFAAPAPVLFLVFNGFCIVGVARPVVARLRERAGARSGARSGARPGERRQGVRHP